MNSEEINDSLCHWGILKQKWGVRRYQNPDGTYTELGKIRKREARGYSDDYNTSRKDPKTLSNNELKTASERKRLESEYTENKIKSSGLTKTQKYLAAGAAAAAALIAAGLVVKKVVDTYKLKNAPENIAYGKKRAEAIKKFKETITVDELADAIHKGETAKLVKSGITSSGGVPEEILSELKKYFVHSDDELSHHGILGQKWGVRRYQNPDGSLTPLGRKRYGVKTYAELSSSQKREVNKLDKEVQAKEDAENANKQRLREIKEEGKAEKALLREQKNAETRDRIAKRITIGTIAIAGIIGVGALALAGRAQNKGFEQINSEKAEKAKKFAKSVADSPKAKTGKEAVKTIILTDRAIPRAAKSAPKANVVYSYGPTVKSNVENILPLLKALPAPKK